MWKERLWQVFLVAILGLTLTMCSRSSSNKSTHSTGILNADGTTTVIVSSLPTITLANAGPNAISHTMFCYGISIVSGVNTYTDCYASDDTVLTNARITHDEAFAAGWKLVGSACGTGNTSVMCVLFHK